jgi:hypothetical protein
MAGQLINLRSAYTVLEERVRISLRTQIGDATRLRQQRDEALLFLSAAEQVQSTLYITKFLMQTTPLHSAHPSISSCRVCYHATKYFRYDICSGVGVLPIL